MAGASLSRPISSFTRVAVALVQIFLEVSVCFFFITRIQSLRLPLNVSLRLGWKK